MRILVKRSIALADAGEELRDAGPAPVSHAAIQASPFLLLIRGALAGDPAALEIAAETGRAICDLTGATGEIVAEARAELLAEQEAEKKSKPLRIGRRDGGLTAPNPHYTGTNPQPWHPARSAPGQVVPAALPGWPT